MPLLMAMDSNHSKHTELTEDDLSVSPVTKLCDTYLATFTRKQVCY